jgi:hypothetical protein
MQVMTRKTETWVRKGRSRRGIPSIIFVEAAAGFEMVWY